MESVSITINASLSFFRGLINVFTNEQKRVTDRLKAESGDKEFSLSSIPYLLDDYRCFGEMIEQIAEQLGITNDDPFGTSHLKKHITN